MGVNQLDKPLVSVVMATHNRANKIGNALDSIIRQSYRPIEIIVVNDASTDNTKQVLENYLDGYKNLITVIELTTNKGPGTARNIGIRHAMGKYVAIMDDDDISLERRLERQVEVLEGAPEVGLCFSSVKNIDQHGNLISVHPKVLTQGEFPSNPKDIFFHLILKGNIIPNVTIMARRDILLLYPYAEDIWIGEDKYMFTSMAAAGIQMMGFPDPLVITNRFGDNLTDLYAKSIAAKRTFLNKVCKTYNIPLTIRWRSFSTQCVREARLYSGMKGLLFLVIALFLNPANCKAWEALLWFMRKGLRKIGLAANQK